MNFNFKKLPTFLQIFQYTFDLSPDKMNEMSLLLAKSNFSILCLGLIPIYLLPSYTIYPSLLDHFHLHTIML